MVDIDIQYLDKFESDLEQELLKVCTSFSMLEGVLLATDDIDAKWKEFAPEYMAEAVKQVNSYPEFTFGCAGYMGLAMARWWDEDWGRHHNCGFAQMLGSRGFDDMDDHIVTDILGYSLDSKEAGMYSKILLACSQAIMTKIRHESIEGQTMKAFHILARALKVMFRIGAAIELHRLGYKFQKVNFQKPMYS